MHVLQLYHAYMLGRQIRCCAYLATESCSLVRIQRRHLHMMPSVCFTAIALQRCASSSYMTLEPLQQQQQYCCCETTSTTTPFTLRRHQLPSIGPPPAPKASCSTLLSTTAAYAAALCLVDTVLVMVEHQFLHNLHGHSRTVVYWSIVTV